MPRGYRYIVFAAFGCLGALFTGLALQPEKPNITGNIGYQAQDAAYYAGGAKCQPDRLNLLAGRKAEAKRDACSEAKEQHRQATNSLIEARRAADAADASTILSYKQTRISAWGMILGFITMLAAICAAWYAKKAADFTERGALADEESAALTKYHGIASLRAYFSVRLDVGFNFSYEQNGCDKNGIPIYTNPTLWVQIKLYPSFYGQTDARNIKIYTKSFVKFAGEGIPIKCSGPFEFSNSKCVDEYIIIGGSICGFNATGKIGQEASCIAVVMVKYVIFDDTEITWFGIINNKPSYAGSLRQTNLIIREWPKLNWATKPQRDRKKRDLL